MTPTPRTKPKAAKTRAMRPIKGALAEALDEANVYSLSTFRHAPPC